jgi:hypothetical protein
MSLVFTLLVIALTGSVVWLLIGRATTRPVNITLAVINLVLLVLWLVLNFGGVDL